MCYAQWVMKTVLFVDGSNLYAGQYDLFGPNSYLNFPYFISEVEKAIQTTFHTIYVYASYSPRPAKPTKKQKAYLKNESLFFKSVRSAQKVVFFKGYRSPHDGKEKLVDVHLAVDIVHKAHQNKYDEMYLMSGDADVMYAIKIALSMGKKTNIVAIQNRIPHRYTDWFNSTILIFNEKKYQQSRKCLSRKKKIEIVLSCEKIVKKIPAIQV